MPCPAADLDTLTAPPVAPGLPSALLRRRPDIAAAEANLVAAHADLEAARTAFLPAITLTASAGLQYPALAAAIDTLPGLGFGTPGGRGPGADHLRWRQDRGHHR